MPDRSVQSSVADSLPDDLIHRIFSFLTAPTDFAAASLLNQHWYAADGTYRRSIKVRNCFAVSPSRLTSRFHALGSLALVGRPHLPDYKSCNVIWPVSADPWIECVSRSYGGLRELELKRFILSDQSMFLISRSFPDLRSLVFVGCQNISSFGLGSVIRGCRYLRALEVRDCSGMTALQSWLMDFPEDCESLVSLCFVNVNGLLDVEVLEKLVLRCRNLKRLKFDQPLPPDVLTRFLKTAPQLVELGFGTLGDSPPGDWSLDELAAAVMNCTSVESLSGAWCRRNLVVMNSLCSKLLFLDLTKMRRSTRRWFFHVTVCFIGKCHNLQRLWVLSCVGDELLLEVGRTCKDLRELKVTPGRGHVTDAAPRTAWTGSVTDAGLAAVIFGCRKLQSVTYSCLHISNAALVDLAWQKPDLRRFELTLIKPDAGISSSLDEGFGAILQSCRNLSQLSITNAYVTDQIFFFAGMFGAQLKKLSVEFAGDSNGGIFYALNLCQNLKQLVIRGPFGNAALLAAAEKLKNIHLFWLNSCGVTVKGSKIVREKFPTLSIDIVDPVGEAKGLPLHGEVKNLLIYHSLGEPHRKEP